MVLLRQLPLLLLALLLLLPPLLRCQVVADDAAAYGTEDRVVMRNVSRDCAHGGALDAALCLDAVRSAEQEKPGQGRRNPLSRCDGHHLESLGMRSEALRTPNSRKSYRA